MTSQGLRGVSRRHVIQAAAGAGVLAGLGSFAGLRRNAAAAAGEIVIGWPGITYRTEIDRATIGINPLNTNIFESLAYLTPDYQIAPMLAESWERVAEHTWRFVLRQGVTFHDGSPFDAEAVKWSMDRAVRAGASAGPLDEGSTVIVDPYTVEITPIEPNLRFLEQLVHPYRGSILAPGTDAAEQRIGTGPFREVEYIPDERYVVEANPDYWGDAPALSRIEFRFFPDPTTRVLALQSGEVDMIAELPRESTLDIASSSDFQVITSPVGAYSAFYVNIHGSEPYDLGQDLILRHAIALGIDKAAIVEGVWQGNAEPGVSVIPPAILGDEAHVVGGTAYDPDAARALLESAGWIEGSGGVREKDGRRLSLEMINGYPNAAIHGQMPEFLQAQLAEIGIEITIVTTPDTPTYEARLQAGQGDLWVESGSQNDANPCFLPEALFSSPDPAGDAESNQYGNAFAPGAAFDAFIGQCSAGETTAEVQAAAANAMKLLIDDEFVVVPIAGVYRIYGAGRSVSGFDAHPSGVSQRWTSLSIDS